MNALINLFLEEHAQIGVYFTELKKEHTDEQKKQLRKELLMILLKHFAEEEQLFKKYHHTEIQEAITKVIEEHKLIISMLKSEDPYITNIHEIIKTHEHIEEYTLYPELEHTVQDNDMQELIKKFLKH
jgi:hypothetical protein